MDGWMNRCVGLWLDGEGNVRELQFFNVNNRPHRGQKLTNIEHCHFFFYPVLRDAVMSLLLAPPYHGISTAAFQFCCFVFFRTAQFIRGSM